MCRILAANLRHYFWVHFALAVCVALLLPVVCCIEELDFRGTAQPLEMVLPFIGMFLLTPVFLPEQNGEICDVVRSRRTDHTLICLLRVLLGVAGILLITGGMALVMQLHGCDVTWQHLAGSAASSLFLGAVGFAAAGVSGNTMAGYMASVIYYVANIGLKDVLGVCYLFSLSSGMAFSIKCWLLGMAAVLITGVLLGVKFLKYR